MNKLSIAVLIQGNHVTCIKALKQASTDTIALSIALLIQRFQSNKWHTNHNSLRLCVSGR